MPMNAGRELDVLIAEKVFGMKVIVRIDDGPVPMPPRFSSDIAAAWSIVLKVKEQGWRMLLDNLIDSPRLEEQDRWKCLFQRGTQNVVQSRGETAPHAICLAALQAVSS